MERPRSSMVDTVNKVVKLIVPTHLDLGRVLRWALVLILYLFTFSLLDQLTHTLQLFPGVVAWYPPDGFSLAFLLTFGMGFTPAFTLASLISSLVIYHLAGPLGPILSWAVILSTLYGFSALLLRRRIRIDPQLNNLRDVLWLILTSAIAATVLAISSVYTLIYYGGIPASQYFNASVQWWIGEMIGVLVFTPFMLVHVMPWLKQFIEGTLAISKRQYIFSRPSFQTIGQIISIPVIVYLVFGVPALRDLQPYYLIAGPLIWIALKNGFSRVSTAIVVINFGIILAIWLWKFDTSHLGEFQFLMFGIYISALLTGAVVTKQKKTEEELRQREVRNRALIENAPDAITLLGADGLLKYLSPAVHRIMGYAPGEMVGSSLAKFTHPDDLPALLELLSELSQTPGAIVTIQYRFRHKDGSWRWLESIITNLLTEPSVLAIIINFWDITERKQSEETLRKSERRFRALIANSLEEISLVDSDGTLKYESPSSQQPLGYPPNSFVGNNLFDLIHPDDRAAALQLLEQVVKRPGNTEEAVYRLRHHDGSWRWMEGTLTNLLDEPAVQAVVINYRDVTARKQAEEEIKNSNEELSMLFVLSHSLAEADNLEDILDLVNRHAVESIHTTFARIALLEDEDFTIRAAHPMRVLGRDLRVGDRKPITALPYSKHILEENEPIIIRPNDPGISNEEKLVLLLDFAQTICLVPLRINDSSSMTEKLIGLLMLGEARDEDREPFTPEKIRLAQTIGGSAAIAIQRILLRKQTEDRMQQLIALSQIDLAIISSSDMILSLGVLISQLIKQLKVDAADIWLFNPTLQQLEYVTGSGFQTPAFEKAKPLHLGEGNAGRAALERRAFYIPNLTVSNENPRLEEALAKEPFISYYAVPLIVKGEVKGVLEIFHRTEMVANEEWLNFLHSLANQAAIAIDNSSLFNDLQQSNIELKQAYDATIIGWSRALDLRDKETEGHTLRVTELTTKLGRLFGLSDEELVHVRRGALLHDIGKMGVPDGILLKPGPLTDEEWVVMRKHTTYAYELLSPIQFLLPALDIPYCHHEKWDGSGYPLGLKGEAIPLAARIFSLVDVYDALTSDRPYRTAWPEKKVLDHIRSLAGTHFDPQVVKICLEPGLLKSELGKRMSIKPVQWTENFSVGVRELDKQHQKLIKLLNRLISMQGSKEAHSEAVSDILLDMTTYTQVHFTAEERLMEAYDFPGLKEHIKQHSDFRKKITDLSTATTIGAEQIPGALLEFISDWLTHHILIDDMAYRSFFREKGLD
jgi:hemerythrin-like metal-binding protein/PAS domain S-box-containing protein/putative nucleotidyltransferase with HDIG domain